MQLVIRRLTPDDARELTRLRLEALQTEPCAFAQSPDEAAATPLEQVAELLRVEGSFVMGAFVDGTLVGMVGFVRGRHHKTSHKGHLWGVYVTTSARHQGVGRQLLAAAIAEARALPGLTQITLAVSADHPEAEHLYERAGFEVYGLEPDALRVDGRAIDQDLMFLRLR